MPSNSACIGRPANCCAGTGFLYIPSVELRWRVFSGWTQIGLNADGTGSYKGHAHDSGPVSYDYAVTTVLLDVKDQAGNNLAFYHPGTVHGSLEIGSSNDDWQDDSLSCIVADNWDAVKTSRTWSHIVHTSIDSAGVVEVIVEAMVGAGLVAAGITLFGSGNWICKWQEGVHCEPVRGQ